jgi:hypothetical protein
MIEYLRSAHARNGAAILREILNKCGVAKSIADEACRLVTLHEVGGDPRSDLLKDADSISFFEVNIYPCTINAKAGRRPDVAAAGAIGVSRCG